VSAFAVTFVDGEHPDGRDDDLFAWANEEAVDQVIEEPEASPDGCEPVARTRMIGGGAFVSSVGDTVPALWGEGSRVVQAKGEPLMIVGPDGVGKTSIAQQLVLAKIGIRDGLCGFPVTAATGPLLYIAADRPRQAASSMRRMVTEADHAQLDEWLKVWKGPLEFDPGSDKCDKGALAALAESVGASEIVIDSLKDVSVDLVKDEVGSRLSVAFQETIARGIELTVLHHQRKEQQGGAKPKRLADVYGSRWLTAGMGSVICLWGDAGDLIIELSHLKQPVEDVGPFLILHDHDTGTSSVHGQTDLLQAVGRAVHGLTVADAAALIYERADPTRNEIEKGRRKLNALVAGGFATREDDHDGTARYFLLAKGA
jgi:replicative DNA helicase